MTEAAPIPDFDVYPVRHAIAAAEPWQGGARVAWADGHVSRFHALWLRDNCPCAACVSPETREQVFDISTVPDDLAVAALAVDDSGALAVAWPDGHASRYHPGWLRAHCYAGPPVEPMPVTTWGANFAIPACDGRRVLDDDGALLAWLEALQETGLTLPPPAGAGGGGRVRG